MVESRIRLDVPAVLREAESSRLGQYRPRFITHEGLRQGAEDRRLPRVWSFGLATHLTDNSPSRVLARNDSMQSGEFSHSVPPGPPGCLLQMAFDLDDRTWHY